MRFKNSFFYQTLLPHLYNLCFSLCIIFPSLLNLAFFYLGFAYMENPVREIGFKIGSVMFAALCGVIFLIALSKKFFLLKRPFTLGALMLFYGVCYGYGLWKFGTKGTLTLSAQKLIIYALPALFMGICGAKLHKEKNIFSVLESVSFFVFPGACIYMNGRAFNCFPDIWDYGIYLGVLNYMTVAYTIMPFLMAHILSFLNQKDWMIPILNRRVRHPQLVRGIFIAIYWFAIICSGTRGTYICVVSFCVLLTGSMWVHGEAPKIRAGCLSMLMIAFLLFNLFVYTPTATAGPERMRNFLDSITTGKISTSDMSEAEIEAANCIDELVAADGGQQVANRPLGAPSPSDGIAAKNLQFINRITLYRLAVGEFLKAPLLGMGPGGYYVKYGIWPHNLFLELLCETGFVGTVFLLALLLKAIANLFLAGQKNRDVRYLLIYFIIYAMQALMNGGGSLWFPTAMFCALGYGLTFRAEEDKISRQGRL